MIKLISTPYIVESTTDMSVSLLGGKGTHYSSGCKMLAAKYETVDIEGTGILA